MDRHAPGTSGSTRSTANLFLHHFDDADLARLFAGLQPLAPLLLATEPRRAGFPHGRHAPAVGDRRQST